MNKTYTNEHHRGEIGISNRLFIYIVIIGQCQISDTISTCRELVSLNPHVDLSIIGVIMYL